MTGASDYSMEELRILLLGYLEKSLPKDKEEEISALLQASEQARRELEELRRLTHTLRTDKTVFCPDVSDVAEFITTGDDVTGRIADHLSQCAACKKEAQEIREFQPVDKIPSEIWGIVSQNLPDKKFDASKAESLFSRLDLWISSLFRRPALAFGAALLATIIVTWELAQIKSESKIEQAKIEQSIQIAGIKSRYEEISKENARLLAELQVQKLPPIAAAVGPAAPNAKKSGPAETLTSQIAKLEEENQNLKKYIGELERLRDRSAQELAHAKAELKALEEKWPEEKEKRNETGGTAVPDTSSGLDPTKGREILRAAQSGAVSVLDNLVDNGNYANYVDKETGERPLHLAALEGNFDAVRILVAKGADLNAKGKDGKTPIMLAAGKGHKNVVEFLLKHGADPKLSDDGGRTALYWALLYGHADVAKFLRSP